MSELVDVFGAAPRHAPGAHRLLFDTGPRVAVGPGGIDGFWQRLDTFMGPGLLAELASLPNLVIAGGCVVGALTSTSACDVDLFILGDPAAGTTALRQVLALVQRAHGWSKLHKVVVTRSTHAVTLYRTCGVDVVGPPIQLILHATDSVQELLAGFDVDCCCAALLLQDRRVLCSERGLRALCSGVNHVDAFFESPSYWRRLEKYGLRGWRVAGFSTSEEDSTGVVYSAAVDLVLRLQPVVRCCDEPACFVQAAQPVTGTARLLLRGSQSLPNPKPPAPQLGAHLVRINAELAVLVWAPCGFEADETHEPSQAPTAPVRALLRKGLVRGISPFGSRFLFDVLDTSASLEEATSILDASTVPAWDVERELGIPPRLTFDARMP